MKRIGARRCDLPANRQHRQLQRQSHVVGTLKPWLVAILTIQLLTHSSSAQSLSDCISAMGTHDVNGDLALSYAEYLNVLVDLTIATVESTDSSSSLMCTPEYAADLILNDPSLFQVEFVQVACHCVDFTSTSNEPIPECVCPNNNNTDTASNNNEGTPSIALPTVYPGAYAVRVCDDISTQLFLLTAECMDLPPIYTPVAAPIGSSAAPTVKVPDNTVPLQPTALQPTGSPTFPPTKSFPTVQISDDETESMPTAAPALQILSTAAPTPWKSVKVPDYTGLLQPTGSSPFPPTESLPTVQINDDETESMPTAAPAMQIIEAAPTTLDVDDSVIVAPAPAPFSEGVAVEDDGANQDSTVLEDDNSKSTLRAMAIVIPILIVATCAVFALLWNRRRQDPRFDYRGNREPRAMKLPAYKVHTEKRDAMGTTNVDSDENKIEGYGNVAQFIKTPSLNHTVSSPLMDMEDTEVSETMEEVYKDDDDENLDCLLSNILDSLSSHEKETARPHLNLVLPSGEAKSAFSSTTGTPHLDVVALRSSISGGESSRSTPKVNSKSSYVMKSLRKSDGTATTVTKPKSKALPTWNTLRGEQSNPSSPNDTLTTIESIMTMDSTLATDKQKVLASSCQSHSSPSSLNIFEDTSIVSSHLDENGLPKATTMVAALSADRQLVKPSLSPSVAPDASNRDKDVSRTASG